MAEADTTSDTTPMPRRFWWLKRIAVVMFLLAGVLVGLRYWSLAVAKRRLEAEIDGIKARGEPLAAADFVEQPAPAEEDAGPDLVAAGQMFAVPRQHLLAWNNINIPRYTYRPQDAATLDAIFSANQQALAKVRSARGKRIVNWGLAMKTPATAIPYPRLWELRQVSEALEIAAKKATAEGRDREAVEYLRDVLTLSRSLETQPVLLSHMIAGVMQGRVSHAIVTIAPTLRIGGGDGSASEAQVRALMQELLDEREALRRGWKWAWQGERMMQLDLVQALASDDDAPRAAMGVNIYGRFLTWWMRPIMVADAEDILGRANSYVRATAARDMPQAAQIVSEWENHDSRNGDLKKLGSAVYGDLNSQYQEAYARREGAVVLAARMFQLKYGREAKGVQELVPQFLAEMPMDPVRGNGQAMVVDPTTRPVGR